MTFKANVLADKKYRRHRKMLTDGVYSLDLRAFRDELESMHAVRKVRFLNLASTHDAQTMLVEAAEQNCANRSRAVEILMQIQRVNSQLDIFMEAMNDYLSSTYSPLLLSEYRTKGERQQAVNSMLAVFVKKQREGESVKEIAELLVADIDAASWTLTRLVSILELNAKVERRL